MMHSAAAPHRHSFLLLFPFSFPSVDMVERAFQVIQRTGMKSRRERVVQVASIESVKEWGEGGGTIKEMEDLARKWRQHGLFGLAIPLFPLMMCVS
jgi:hypothetical protein